MEEYARIKCEMAEGLYFANESLKKRARRLFYYSNAAAGIESRMSTFGDSSVLGRFGLVVLTATLSLNGSKFRELFVDSSTYS